MMSRLCIRRGRPPEAPPDIILDAAGRVEITHVHCEEELVWSNLHEVVEAGGEAPAIIAGPQRNGGERQPTDGNFTGFEDVAEVRDGIVI